MVAGSNPVSPTLFRQVKCYVYLLPMLTTRGEHLIRCQRRPGIASSLPGSKPALSCVFCSESDPRMAGRSYARIVTRKSDDGGPSFLQVPKVAIELGFFFRSAGRSVMTAAWVIVTDLSQGASGSTVAAGSARR